ncbi:hypothetical protein B0O99DRAFT_695094 [Bisporella sp. PMI_857]|nr:hypothetical protein B0O99DRAFT_695094 [Bisporella sp. PMI_857]
MYNVSPFAGHRRSLTPFINIERRKTRSIPLSFGLVIIFCIVAITRIWNALDESGDFRSSASSLHKRIGNGTAANDLYGLGVRIGIYAQATGILMSSGCRKVGGIKIACSATMIALLACWTLLADDRAFSACEAFLVLTLVQFASIWAVVASFWFWGTLYAQLPRLGTKNQAWMFARVSVRGWFRIFMLVSASISTGISILITVLVYLTVRKANKGDSAGQPVTQKELDAAKEVEKWNTIFNAALGGVILVLTIPSAEMIIRYNNLDPENTITSPGQLIPLTIGVIVLVDGITTIFDVIVINRRSQKGMALTTQV